MVIPKNASRARAREVGRASAPSQNETGVGDETEDGAAERATRSGTTIDCEAQAAGSQHSGTNKQMRYKTNKWCVSVRVVWYC